MTLKQFLELALGLLLAYIFYASNLIFIFKWPLIILSILFGAGLAFFPLEDRPLDQWIINFLKAIYAPTRFTWQKTNKIPRLFLFTAHAPEVVNSVTKTIKAPSTTSTIKPISDLSDVETAKLTSLDSIFKSLPPTTPQPTANNSAVPEEIAKPSISIRKLKPVEEVSDITLHAPVAEPTPIEHPTAPTPTAEPIAHNVIFSAPTAPTAHTTTIKNEASPIKHITLPAAPKLPNLITGVVVDKDGKLVENAIVQIVEAGGIPARAMKTNSLGQFYTSTPLSPGTYVIEVDKENLSFPPQQITINDTVIRPIELRAQ
jgi:hypothetical protein